MILSFNPVNVNHWIKKHFIDSGLATVVHSTYKDNKFLTDEDRKVLESFKYTDQYYYQVYCLGQWRSIRQDIFQCRKSNKQNSRIKRTTISRFFFIWLRWQVHKERKICWRSRWSNKDIRATKEADILMF